MAKKKGSGKATKKATAKKTSKKASQQRDSSQMFRNTEYSALGDLMDAVYENERGNATLADVRAELKKIMSALDAIINGYGEDCRLDDYNDAAEAEDVETSRQDEAAHQKSKKKSKKR